MTTTNVTAKTFRRTLSAWTTSQTKQRDVLHHLLMFGFQQYKDHGNTGFLSEAICSVIKVKSLPTNNIKEYVKAHANVALHQVKDAKPGDLQWVFKKQGKEVKVTMPTIVWYAHTTNKSAKPIEDIDGLKLLRNALIKALKADTDGKLKAGQQATVKKAAAMLKELLDTAVKVDKPNGLTA